MDDQKTTSPEKQKLLEFFNPNNPDFMGSGLNFSEFMLMGDIKRFKTSFGSQKNTEQRRRLDYIIKASVALHEIRKESIFASGLCEMAIEDIIKGDWNSLQRWAGKIPIFEVASDIKEACEVLWVPFIKIIREAIKTWPEEGKT